MMPDGEEPDPDYEAREREAIQGVEREASE